MLLHEVIELNRRLAAVLVLVFAAFTAGLVLSLDVSAEAAPHQPVKPTPNPRPTPPKPSPRPRPKPRPKPWLPAVLPVGQGGWGNQTSWMNGRQHGNETLAADFPAQLWFANIGSHIDKAGMCVTSSVEMTALYLGLEDFRGFRDWCANEPGGCYPDKLEDQLKRYCDVKGITCPPYVNFEGPDPEPLLRRLDEEGIPFAHTYGWSPRYNQKIAHMVFSAKFGGNYAVVVDNNAIGGLDPATGTIYEWMDLEEHVRRMKYDSGSAWVFAFLVPPPPPCPKAGD